MKKRWMILTVALVMSLLTACGGKEPAPASSTPADTKPAASQAEPADKSEATLIRIPHLLLYNFHSALLDHKSIYDKPEYLIGYQFPICQFR